jgi:uncharacterized membrane protein
MTPPFWALSIAYWLHMLATVIWIGGLAILALFILPYARQTLNRDAMVLLFERLQPRFDALAWFSLILLTGTGLVQMSAHPNYEGAFNFGSRWAAAILLKHLVFLGMIAVNAYLTWGVLPGLRRLAILKAQTGKTPPDEEIRLTRMNTRLIHLNLALGIVVLAFTALARVS